ncbi:MAG TPA: site-specific integrase [Bdellovibrionota bacterium]|nr:site-specific integrase [Bdellovibrionota bacterium]
MGVYKKDQNWFIDYYVNHKRYRESVGPGTKRDAEKALAKRKVQIKENRIFDKKLHCDLTFEEMAKGFIDSSKGRPGTRARNETSCKHLVAYFKARKIRDIQPSDVEAYKESRSQDTKRNGKPIMVSTVNRELACMKAMFNHFIRDRKIDFNPVRDVSFFNEEHLQRDRVLTPEEFDTLLDAASPDLRPILELAYYTAMRKGEILNLTWDKVDVRKGFIHLTPEDTKTSRKRDIPLNAHLVDLLTHKVRRLHCDYVFDFRGKRLGNFKTAFKNACRRAGIENFHFHDLRHTAITRWVKAGIPESAVMMVSGHRTRSVFDRYVNLKTEDVKELMERADSGGASNSALAQKGMLSPRPN